MAQDTANRSVFEESTRSETTELSLLLVELLQCEEAAIISEMFCFIFYFFCTCYFLLFIAIISKSKKKIVQFVETKTCNYLIFLGVIIT